MNEVLAMWLLALAAGVALRYRAALREARP